MKWRLFKYFVFPIVFFLGFQMYMGIDLRFKDVLTLLFIIFFTGYYKFLKMACECDRDRANSEYYDWMLSGAIKEREAAEDDVTLNTRKYLYVPDGNLGWLSIEPSKITMVHDDEDSQIILFKTVKTVPTDEDESAVVERFWRMKYRKDKVEILEVNLIEDENTGEAYLQEKALERYSPLYELANTVYHICCDIDYDSLNDLSITYEVDKGKPCEYYKASDHIVIIRHGRHVYSKYIRILSETEDTLRIFAKIKAHPKIKNNIDPNSPEYEILIGDSHPRDHYIEEMDIIYTYDLHNPKKVYKEHIGSQIYTAMGQLHNIITYVPKRKRVETRETDYNAASTVYTIATKKKLDPKYNLEEGSRTAWGFIPRLLGFLLIASFWVTYVVDILYKI